MADSGLIAQASANLVSASSEPGGGTLVVASRRAAPDGEIRVADQDGTRPRTSEIFRLYCDEGGGSNIGLAMVYRIITRCARPVDGVDGGQYRDARSPAPDAR
jgi:hypothetical protein